MKKLLALFVIIVLLSSMSIGMYIDDLNYTEERLRTQIIQIDLNLIGLKEEMWEDIQSAGKIDKKYRCTFDYTFKTIIYGSVNDTIDGYFYEWIKHVNPKMKKKRLKSLTQSVNEKRNKFITEYHSMINSYNNHTYYIDTWPNYLLVYNKTPQKIMIYNTGLNTRPITSGGDILLEKL